MQNPEVVIFISETKIEKMEGIEVEGGVVVNLLVSQGPLSPP
jgi:hypothetical protein